jgi:hypothetical protein
MPSFSTAARIGSMRPAIAKLDSTGRVPGAPLVFRVEDAVGAGLFVCVPSMIDSLEVEVLDPA